MSPNEVRELENRELVELIAGREPSEAVVSVLATVLSDDVAYEGVQELRRRFGRLTAIEVPTTITGRAASSQTVFIDPDRWAAFAFRRRLAMTDLGPMIGRCEGWGSVMKARGRAGFYALDSLACTLGMHVDELIREVGTVEELQRMSA